MSKRLELTGKKFGRLTILKRFWVKDKQSMYCQCECDCGKIIKIRSNDVVYGKTKSCGCFRSEYVTKKNFKHGHTYLKNGKTFQSGIYQVWAGMIQRCTNKKSHAYKYYGARGITVCKRWTKFKCFLEDMGERPDGMTIERKNNNGDYEPGNCCWATDAEQNRNQRKNIIIEFDGKNMCLSELSRTVGINMYTLWDRVRRKGWTIERAITTPVRKMHLK